MNVDMLKRRRFAILIVLTLFIFFTIHYFRALSPSKKHYGTKGNDSLEIEKIAQSLKSTLNPFPDGNLEKNITFKILVYGWKRRASLRRLLDSLSAVDYRGFKTSLEIHIEGDYHPLVVQYINSYSWPHGTSAIKKRRYKAGLENVQIFPSLIMTCVEYCRVVEPKGRQRICINV